MAENILNQNGATMYIRYSKILQNEVRLICDAFFVKTTYCTHIILNF